MCYAATVISVSLIYSLNLAGAAGKNIEMFALSQCRWLTLRDYLTLANATWHLIKEIENLKQAIQNLKS